MCTFYFLYTIFVLIIALSSLIYYNFFNMADLLMYNVCNDIISENTFVIIVSTIFQAFEMILTLLDNSLLHLIL
jgi:hypothetical protein